MAKLVDFSRKNEVGKIGWNSSKSNPTCSNQVGMSWNQVGINPTCEKHKVLREYNKLEKLEQNI